MSPTAFSFLASSGEDKRGVWGLRQRSAQFWQGSEKAKVARRMSNITKNVLLLAQGQMSVSTGAGEEWRSRPSSSLGLAAGSDQGPSQRWEAGRLLAPASGGKRESFRESTHRTNEGVGWEAEREEAERFFLMISRMSGVWKLWSAWISSLIKTARQSAFKGGASMVFYLSNVKRQTV